MTDQEMKILRAFEATFYTLPRACLYLNCPASTLDYYERTGQIQSVTVTDRNRAFAKSDLDALKEAWELSGRPKRGRPVKQV